MISRVSCITISSISSTTSTLTTRLLIRMKDMVSDSGTFCSNLKYQPLWWMNGVPGEQGPSGSQKSQTQLQVWFWYWYQGSSPLGLGRRPCGDCMRWEQSRGPACRPSEALGASSDGTEAAGPSAGCPGFSNPTRRRQPIGLIRFKMAYIFQNTVVKFWMKCNFILSSRILTKYWVILHFRNQCKVKIPTWTRHKGHGTYPGHSRTFCWEEPWASCSCCCTGRQNRRQLPLNCLYGYSFQICMLFFFWRWNFRN